MLHRRIGAASPRVVEMSRSFGHDGLADAKAGAHIIHASAVAIDGRAVLIQGASGSGKSGLALRMIALGATLVADDRVMLERVGEEVHASAPETLRGLVEARGVGLLRATRVVDSARVVAVVDLDFAPAARMPQLRVIDLLGVEAELILGRGVPNLDAVLVFIVQNERYRES